MSAINEVGNRYGRLVVLRRDGNLGKQAAWQCQCDCGNQVTVRGYSLRCGDTNSCGCLAKELTRAGRNTLPEGEAAFNQLYSSMRRSARYRHYPWGLSEEQVHDIITKECYYCGAKPGRIARNGDNCNGVYVCNGIDRVDNDKGYTIENVVPCCRACNMAKGTMSQDEFLELVMAIYSEHFA